MDDTTPTAWAAAQVYRGAAAAELAIHQAFDAARAAGIDPASLPFSFCANNTTAAIRAADAAISDQAIEAEFRAWWKAHVHPLSGPSFHAVSTHVAWARHILSRGQL